MRKVNIRIALSIISLVIMGSAPNSFAAQTGDQVNVNFEGTFNVSSPCTINNNEVMEIPFGNVGINKVDGIAYIRTIPFSIDCNGAADSTPLSLKITGIQESFDDAAVTTNADGLGIQIQLNDKPMVLNEALSTTLGEASSFTLKAVPVKDPSKDLTEQPFTATATLTADYQ